VIPAFLRLPLIASASAFACSVSLLTHAVGAATGRFASR